MVEKSTAKIPDPSKSGGSNCSLTEMPHIGLEIAPSAGDHPWTGNPSIVPLAVCLKLLSYKNRVDALRLYPAILMYLCKTTSLSNTSSAPSRTGP